jgi:hypothetical protein
MYLYLHKQLVMDWACGTEECHEAGLGTPSALLDADRCSFGHGHYLAEALISEGEDRREQRHAHSIAMVSRPTPRPPAGWRR